MSVNTNGLSSRRLLEFYKGCDAGEVINHGLLITRNGETLFEHYIYPYSAEMPHTLFSVTKSLISTAVGFAIDEGLITLDTKVGEYFKDYEQSKGTEFITVRRLLTMHSGKKFSFLQDMMGDYVEIFMKAGFRSDRGFLYSNNDVHILSALLQRVTGMPVVDYLMPRLFTPLGIEKPEWETDCKGVCVGGTGAYLTLRSLVRIVQCYVDGGKYEGKQVIPEFWTREATKKQVDFDPKNPTDNGYGYLFWTYKDFFCMNGMYGQIIAGYPATGTVIGYTNCTFVDVPLFRLSEECLVPALSEPDTPEDNRLLEEYLNSKDEKTVSRSERGVAPTGTYRMSGVSRKIAELFFPAGLIPRSISSSMAKRPTSSFDRFSFSQSDDEVAITWYEEEDQVTVKCGLDGTPHMSECSLKGYRYILWSYGWWEGNILRVKLRPINTLSSLMMSFNFENDGFSLKVSAVPGFTGFILTNLNQVKAFAKYKPLNAMAGGVMKLILRTAEAEMKFRKIIG